MTISSAIGVATPLSPNYIINGAFEINQRNFTNTASSVYGFDRWRVGLIGGTCSYSSQSFAVGESPAPNFQPTNYARIVSSGHSATSDWSALIQSIENVRTLAGQVATISFYSRATSGTPQVALTLEQRFGPGGSANSILAAGRVTVDTTWKRYSITTTIPSVAGKTIPSPSLSDLGIYLFTSAGSGMNIYTGGLGFQNTTIDFWGVQVEAGSVATPFRLNANSIQGELAACQRYFWSPTAETNPYMPIASCYGITTTTGFAIFEFPVTMRTKPTFSVDLVSNFQLGFTNINYSISSLVQNMDGTSTNRALVAYVPGSALGSATQASMLYRSAGVGLTGSIGFSAEL